MTSMQQVASLFRLGERDRALELIRSVPASAQRNRAWISMLIQGRSAHDLKQAKVLAKEWLKWQPANPEPLQRLVEIALFENRLDEADVLISKFAKTSPGNPAVHILEGVVLQLSGQVGMAEKAFQQAEVNLPGPPGSVNLRAALRMYEVASGNYPGSPGRNDLQLLDQDDVARRLEQALIAWETQAGAGNDSSPVEDRKAFSNAWYNLGCRVMPGFSQVDECIAYFDRAIEWNPGHVLARSNRLFVMNYSETVSSSELSRQHRQFGQWLEEQSGRSNESVSGAPDSTESDRLVVGYLSSDFRQHSVAHYILPVLQHHDYSSVTVHCYHNDPRQDEVTRSIMETGAHYRNVAGMSDEELMRQVRKDGVQVLVELNGLTEGHRLTLLAQRCAPVQVSWIGYPNTTGLTTIDYRLVDGVTDPKGSGDALCTEKLYRLGSIFSAYAFLGELPEISQAPCEENRFVTFGSFNTLAKINKSLVGLWARILDLVPGSRLLIKNIALDCQVSRQRLSAAFEALGVDLSRIEMHGKVAGQGAHMEFFNRVDLCLDSFPYNGTTTNCDSLLMGVPFVTLKGDTHRSRVGASQLACLGLDQWVANDRDDYVRIASDLANDPDSLIEWRRRLRGKLQSSPLMDAENLAREVELAYRQMWSKKTNK